MKAWTFASLLVAVSTNAHSIFQDVSVNGVDQGYLVGVRAPSTNNPNYDVTQAAIACNTGLVTPVSTAVVNIPAGAKVGAYWEHVLGGPQFAGDPDNPIASSHHGPIQVYLAKVDNAGTSGTSGLSWFKISSDGLTNGVWGVDNMVANKGWNYFTMPSCIAPGNYLMRVEIIALHNAYNSLGAQFYMSCANINVTGSGSGSFTPSSTVSFPGAYVQNDPGILINIYDSSGNPTNGGKPYVAPGPAVITCSAGSSPASSSAAPPTSSTSSKASTSSTSSTSSSSKTSTTSTSSTKTSSASGAGQTLYGQCGGTGWTGPTTCSSGTCKVSNAYYSQCLPS